MKVLRGGVQLAANGFIVMMLPFTKHTMKEVVDAAKNASNKNSIPNKIKVNYDKITTTETETQRYRALLFLDLLQRNRRRNSG